MVELYNLTGRGEWLWWLLRGVSAPFNRTIMMQNDSKDNDELKR